MALLRWSVGGCRGLATILLLWKLFTVTNTTTTTTTTIITEAFHIQILPHPQHLHPWCCSSNQLEVVVVVSHTTRRLSVLAATGDPKRKRRRKTLPSTPTQDPVKLLVENDDDDDDDDNNNIAEKWPAEKNDMATFGSKKDKEISMGLTKLENDEDDTSGRSSDAISLPDIKEARKRKQLEEEMARMEQDREEQRVRIKRTDKKAMARVRFASHMNSGLL